MLEIMKQLHRLLGKGHLKRGGLSCLINLTLLSEVPYKVAQL